MADGITKIAVEGFKSIAKRREIEIAPLTILAGANSSGKSSIMQPLLLLKQTLEATYDPGPLKIDGPNVKFTSSQQFLSRCAGTEEATLRIEIGFQDAEFDTTFRRTDSGIQVIEERTVTGNRSHILRPDMDAQQIAAEMRLPELLKLHGLHVGRDRFFLVIESLDMPSARGSEWVTSFLRNVIHLPSLRGTRERTYPVSATGPNFPGTFDNYTASVILAWQKDRSRHYEGLNDDLRRTGLAQEVFAHRVNDVSIELFIGGLAEDFHHTINIADVGFGVSQVLPALVALRAADEGRLVYLEEPEIDLHPLAQTKLADVLAGAAKRGVRVVAETHSSLLLRAVQTLVAKGDLPPELVRLHWFSRDGNGVTQVNTAKLDANGAFGDWPEDFGDVALASEKEYLDAVEDRLTH